jgi:hypothetical protein
MPPTFEELCAKVAMEKEVWVKLYDDIKICLVGIEDPAKQTFVAKFLPCAKNSRVYNIPCSRVRSISKRGSGD